MEEFFMTELLSLPEVLAVVKCSRATIYILMQRDSFPRPLKVGRNNCWIASEVDEWITQQATARVA